ncbi:hypothetical protein [Leucothrix arctica]|uniref:Uncharacterized protein n=1 Tax=Leucothrix arctica TaxID=1481894 RepID=A0A317CN98_9GAMM|nr:hypothetical protein [Leucothrix arctica]PWQ97790.1 hypothetical protein DKT75_05880 [Leucothrix arctica]
MIEQADFATTRQGSVKTSILLAGAISLAANYLISKRRDLPRQQIKLEIANIPSYSREPRALQVNYPMDTTTVQIVN